MSGLPGFNYPAFNAAAEQLRALGFEVENPADNPEPPCGSWSGWMRLGLAQLLRCDAVLLLEGWRGSRGARLEQMVAASLGLHMVESVADLVALLADPVLIEERPE